MSIYKAKAILQHAAGADRKAEHVPNGPQSDVFQTFAAFEGLSEEEYH